MSGFAVAGGGFPDALAGGPVRVLAAAAHAAPLLLVGQPLPAVTETALEALGARRLAVLGGEAVVPEAVVAHLDRVRRGLPTVNDVALDGDGLGVAGFGQPAEEALAALSGALGPPDRDERFECVMGPARMVSWDRHDLRVTFATDPPGQPPGQPLTDWTLAGTGVETGDERGGVVLRTRAGIGLGATVAELRAAYPGLELFPAPWGPMFGTDAGVYGVLTGFGDADRVTYLRASGPDTVCPLD